MNEPKQEDKMESATLGELYKALAKTQGEMGAAATDSKNPFFKSNYADLSAVVGSSRPYLAKNGLCVIQRVLSLEGVDYLATRLAHGSGEWLESRIQIQPQKADIQTLGSYITYLRRYSYAAMIGVVTRGEDDDGERAMERSATYEKITKEQLSELSEQIGGRKEIEDRILKAYGVSGLSHLPRNRFAGCMKGVELATKEEQ